MKVQGRTVPYARPAITDYGSLTEITASVHPAFGTLVPHDLSFSAPNGSAGGGPGGGGDTGSAPAGGGPDQLAGTASAGGPPPASAPLGSAPGSLSAPGTGGVLDAGGAGPGQPGGTAAPSGHAFGAGPSGGGTAGGGVSGAGSGGLPFTGFVPAVVAGLGTGFAAAGAALRKALQGRDRR
jgi:hypothetical protein